MDRSVNKSVIIAEQSQESIINMQAKIISVVEEIQFMAALSFENGEFVDEVDGIADEIKGVDKEINSHLSFFKTSEPNTDRTYHKKSIKEDESLEDSGILF